MRNRWKVLCMCFVLFASVLVEPVSYARADEGVYSEEVPYLDGIKFNMQVNKESNRGLQWDIFMKDKDVDSFIFEFDKLDGVNYEDYEVVFDMVLKSQLLDGQITTYEYTKSFDVTSCKPGLFDSWDSFLMNIKVADEFYKVSMDFETLIKNSPDCIAEEKFVSDSLNYTVKKIYVYNTVITEVDCYLREKSSGNYGLVSRFLLTWDEDFRNALCTNVTYNLILPVTGEIMEDGSIANESGSYGYDSDGNNLKYKITSAISDVGNFLVDIPLAVVAFVKGFYNCVSLIGQLFKVTFPFIPGVIFDIFGIFIFLSIAFSVWLYFKE